MPRAILKYTLQKQRVNTIHMPVSATFLAAQEQHGNVAIWMLVKNDAYINEQREFHSMHTAEPIADDLTYLATVQLHDGHTVIHLFERELQA